MSTVDKEVINPQDNESESPFSSFKVPPGVVSASQKASTNNMTKGGRNRRQRKQSHSRRSRSHKTKSRKNKHKQR